MVEDLIGGVISNTVYDIIKAGAREVFGSRLGKDIAETERDQALEAYRHAMEEWLVELIETFHYLGFDEPEIRTFFAPYQEALPKFLIDEEVADELLKPFTIGETHRLRLDHARLVERWQASGFSALPEEFPAQAACRRYLKRLNDERIVTPELRNLLRTQMEFARTEVLRDLRGHWPDFDIDQYRERVRDRYRIIDLSALTPPERTDPEDSGIRLRDIFVAQDVREYVPVRELPKEYWRELAGGKVADAGKLPLPEGMRAEQFEQLRQDWASRPRQPVLETICAPDARHVVILGDPGSGKSTLARYLLLSLLDAERRSSDPTTAWLNPLAGHLPLLVELRDYIAKCKERHCSSFLEYWHHLGKAEGFALNINDLDYQLSERPALVIFDGLDEVLEGERRANIVEQIVGFAHDHPAARILVTSRITGYQRYPFDSAAFRNFTLQELTQSQIETFARGWFEIVFHGKPEEAAHRRARITEALANSPAIRQLAGNPLLLTMIAIIARHQELPRDRSKLYDHAVKVLCHHWDLTGHKIPQEGSQIGFLAEDDKLELLRRIAWRMQSDPQSLAGNYILENDLRAEMDSYFEQRWQLPPIERAPILFAIIKQLRERNFILCLYGSGIYGFVHRTFLEFLCAQELVVRFEKQRTLTEAELESYFVLKGDDEVWHEILRLVCGMVDSKFAGQFIAALTPSGPSIHAKANVLILGVQCLSEIADLHRIPLTCDRVLTGICDLLGGLPPRIRVGDRWRFGFEVNERFVPNAVPAIEAIGSRWPGRERYVPRITTLMRGAWSDPNALARIVHALWTDCPGTKPALEALLRSRSEGAWNYGAQALARCFPATSLPLLRDAAESDQTEGVREAAVWALAQHFAGAPQTPPFLRRIAETDQSADVRRAAVWSLAQHFAQDPETLDLLRRLAGSDKPGDVRAVAVSALADHFAKDPETLRMLRRLVESEQPREVRAAAVSALAEHFVQDPETLLALHQVVDTDEDEEVQDIAIDALAEHFATDSETLPLLRRVAENGPSQDMRSTAVSALAEHFANDTETLPLLRRLSESNGTAVWSLAQHFAQDAETLPLLRRVAEGDQPEAAGAAVSALARHFGQDPETLPLLRRMAESNRADQVRYAAISALAEHFVQDPETPPLIRRAARHDQDEGVRRAALLSLGYSSPTAHAAVLLSRDLDGMGPGLDSLEPIDSERVKKSAERLVLSLEQARELYEQLAKEVPLRLEWRARARRSSTTSHEAASG